MVDEGRGLLLELGATERDVEAGGLGVAELEAWISLDVAVGFSSLLESHKVRLLRGKLVLI